MVTTWREHKIWRDSCIMRDLMLVGNSCANPPVYPDTRKSRHKEIPPAINNDVHLSTPSLHSAAKLSHYVHRTRKNFKNPLPLPLRSRSSGCLEIVSKGSFARGMYFTHCRDTSFQGQHERRWPRFLRRVALRRRCVQGLPHPRSLRSGCLPIVSKAALAGRTATALTCDARVPRLIARNDRRAAFEDCLILAASVRAVCQLLAQLRLGSMYNLLTCGAGVVRPIARDEGRAVFGQWLLGAAFDDCLVLTSSARAVCQLSTTFSERMSTLLTRDARVPGLIARDDSRAAFEDRLESTINGIDRARQRNGCSNRLAGEQYGHDPDAADGKLGVEVL